MGIVELVEDESCIITTMPPVAGFSESARRKRLAVARPPSALLRTCYRCGSTNIARVPPRGTRSDSSINMNHRRAVGGSWRPSVLSAVNARGRQLFCYVAEDITARRQAEDAIRESQSRFRSMADNVPGLIWLSDLHMKRTYFNKTWLEFTGRSIEQELGDGWTDNLHPDDREAYRALYHGVPHPETI